MFGLPQSNGMCLLIQCFIFIISLLILYFKLVKLHSNLNLNLEHYVARSNLLNKVRTQTSFILLLKCAGICCSVYKSVMYMMSAKRKCSNNPDVFCCVCGEFTLTKDPHKINERVEKSYFW